jgi:hypothetical protein
VKYPPEAIALSISIISETLANISGTIIRSGIILAFFAILSEWQDYLVQRSLH